MESTNKKGQKELLTVKDLAKLLVVSERTIYNKVSAGNFPIRPIRIGRRLLRWRRHDIDEYIASL
jgi:excisionase family DNA binding protein